jgi:hypothetical protein
MNTRAVLCWAVLAGSVANGQDVRTAPRKMPGIEKPACFRGAICFSGEVKNGGEFRKSLNANLEFSLKLPDGMAVVPKTVEGECQEFTSVVNGPYRGHRDFMLTPSYGWTAEQEVAASPREFRFVMKCVDYRVEYERLMIVLGSTPVNQQQYDKAMADLGTSALGKARVWITDSKVTHANDTPDDTSGQIQWIKFSVEILLPAGKD